jgi:uncharacterized phage-associated protein
MLGWRELRTHPHNPKPDAARAQAATNGSPHVWYLAHGWHLAMNDNKPLISDPVQAWKYGPVIQRLYREFKPYGNGAITSPAREGSSVPVIPDNAPEIPLLDKVWESYSTLTALQLSSLTHQKDSPWYKTWHDNDGKNEMGAIIPNDLIAEYYRGKLNAAT